MVPVLLGNTGTKTNYLNHHYFPFIPQPIVHVTKMVICYFTLRN